MKTFLAFSILIAFGTVSQAAEPVIYQSGPKNLVSPTYRGRIAPSKAEHRLSKKEVKRLTATAKSTEEHLKLADYYRTEAAQYEASGEAYERAAAASRNGEAKNLMAPTTAGRFEYQAKELREKATRDRALMASHEQMVKASAGL